MKIIKKITVILLLITIVSTLLPLTAGATTRTVAWGAANSVGNGVRIRSGPGLSNDILAQASRGDIIVILERTNDDWFRVNYKGTVGFVNTPLLERPRTVADFTASGSIAGSRVNLRELPDIDSSVLGIYTQGTVMNVVGLNNGWYKVRHDNLVGYIRSDNMDLIAPTPATPTESAGTGTSTAAASTRVTPTQPAPNPDVELGQQIVDYALSLVGSKYVYGGASPAGFDCSGFTSYVFKQFDIRLTRHSAGQYRDNGVHIEKSELSPGDLVFTSSNGRTVTHVGIYIGDNKIVHASSPRVGVVISSLSSGNYTRTFFGAKRIV